MLINKIDNYYIIKLPNINMNIYDLNELEKLTKKIISKINKNNKLNNYLHLEFYLNDNYGTIIKLKDYKKALSMNSDKTIKITIHTESPFLYKIDYFDINVQNKDIYYYKNNFYLKLKENINKEEYIKLLEQSEIIYEDTLDIIDKAIKI